MIYTKADERPRCPEGHDPANVNKAGTHKTGKQIWYCYLCNRRFWWELADGVDKTHWFSRTAPLVVKVQAQRNPDVCPRCGSDRLEKEHDGTIVCWSCDWFK